MRLFFFRNASACRRRNARGSGRGRDILQGIKGVLAEVSAQIGGEFVSFFKAVLHPKQSVDEKRHAYDKNATQK